MPLNYENLVRGVLLLLLALAQITDHVPSPSITLISFLVFEYIIRKLEKPAVVKDYSSEVKVLQDKLDKLDEDVKLIKGDIGVAKIGSMLRKG